VTGGEAAAVVVAVVDAVPAGGGGDVRLHNSDRLPNRLPCV